MPCMLVAGLALQLKDWRVKSVRANSGGGGNLRLAEGNSWALPRVLDLGAITAGQGATMVEL